MNTQIAKRLKTTEMRRKETNAVIHFIKENRITLGDFVKEFNSKNKKLKLPVSTFRYKLRSATFTNEELKAVSSLVELIKQDLNELNQSDVNK